ncbi:MAG: hypothetical protein HZB46_12830 [Solirubrobacterales bacterium]|nr:hypothetical protein [Solirubrobacterales bacterium]
MFETIFNLVLLAIGVVVVAYVTYRYVKDGDKDRFEEDAARAFFEEHGRWPDQTPEEAEEERRRVAAAMAAPAPVSVPRDDGSV